MLQTRPQCGISLLARIYTKDSIIKNPEPSLASDTIPGESDWSMLEVGFTNVFTSSWSFSCGLNGDVIKRYSARSGAWVANEL